MPKELTGSLTIFAEIWIARSSCLSSLMLLASRNFTSIGFFRTVSGETLNNFTNRLRIEKAARLLRYSDQSLTDIALDCGFSSSATFSRAFRSDYDTSPSQFRRSGEIKKSKICKELFPQDEYGLPMSAEEKRAAFPVRLIDILERQVAYIRGYECLRTG
jgi:AraC family transcriptional regulator